MSWQRARNAQPTFLRSVTGHIVSTKNGPHSHFSIHLHLLQPLSHTRNSTWHYPVLPSRLVIEACATQHSSEGPLPTARTLAELHFPRQDAGCRPAVRHLPKRIPGYVNLNVVASIIGVPTPCSLTPEHRPVETPKEEHHSLLSG